MDRQNDSNCYNLSVEEQKRIATLFNQLDINQDGRIDINDLTAALHQLQVPQVPGQAQVTFCSPFFLVVDLAPLSNVCF